MAFPTVFLLGCAHLYQQDAALILTAAAFILYLCTWFAMSPPLLSTYILWTIGILFLFPIFPAGIDFHLFIIVISVLFLLVYAVVTELFVWDPPVVSLVSVVKALAAVSIVAVLLVSNPFLIHGIENRSLTAGLFVLELSLISIPVSVGVKLFQLRSTVILSILTIITTLLFLVTFFTTANGAMARPDVARFMTAKMQHGSFLINQIARSIDRDDDFYSPVFGFGDCDDFNKARHPLAIDWPGNGVDENCFNGDLKKLEHSYFSIPISIAPPDLKSLKTRKVAVLVVIENLDYQDFTAKKSVDSTTPFLSSAAEKSVRFSHAHAQSNNRLESYPFLFHMGFRTLPLYNPTWTLLTNLRSNDVVSIHIPQNSVRTWWPGDLYKTLLGFERTPDPRTLVGSVPPNDVASLALAELETFVDKSIFVFLNFDMLLKQAEKKAAPTSKDQAGFLTLLDSIYAPKSEQKEEYQSALSEIDRAVGTVWEAVRELEEGDEDTEVLFLITSTHGTGSNEDNVLTEERGLYDSDLRVPLLAYQTGIKSREESIPVGLGRITPTILKFFGFEGEVLDKLNLLSDSITPYEISGYYSRERRLNERSFFVLDEGYKLIYHSFYDQLELYNVEKDPKEERNLVGLPDVDEILSRLKTKMDITLFYMNYGDVVAARRRQAPQTKPDTDE